MWFADTFSTLQILNLTMERVCMHGCGDEIYGYGEEEEVHLLWRRGCALLCGGMGWKVHA